MPQTRLDNNALPHDGYETAAETGTLHQLIDDVNLSIVGGRLLQGANLLQT